MEKEMKAFGGVRRITNKTGVLLDQQYISSPGAFEQYWGVWWLG